MRETCLIGSLRFHAPSHGGAPHVVHVVATSVEHRDADRLLHEQRRRVEEARQRCGVLELRRMVGRQNQRRAARHGQADNAVARHRDLLVGRQPQRKLTGEKRLPFIGIGLLVEARGRIPVGVEAGLAADGHHGRDAGLVEPLERRGVDVPAAVVVLFTKEGQKIWAQAGFRPVDPSVAADFATDFPTPQKLWTIDDLGGWTAVDPALFDKDNGSITKIYKQATG